jgi:hypothetical protein
VRATQQLDITYGHYLVTEADGDPPLVDAHEIERLITAAEEGGAVIATVTFFGPVEVTVEVLDGEPATDSETWDRVEGVTLVAQRGEVIVTDIEGEGDYPSLILAPGQRYQLRVSARGLAAAAERPDDATATEALEQHLLQLWPHT